MFVAPPDSANSSFCKRVDIWLHTVIHKPAKTHKRHRKSQSFPPPIPAEIWGLIIYHACLLYHDPLDTSKDLSFFDHHAPSLQLDTYHKAMKLKTTIALVSRQWNALGRMGLYEFVWIGRAAQAKALARTLLMEYVDRSKITPDNNDAQSLSSGSYVRRLHIETPVLERCCPADIRAILDFTPSLYIYSDHHSLQRSMFNDSPDPKCTPEELLKLIAHPRLKRLSWTTYGDVPFSERMSPLMDSGNCALNLEYLELNCCSPNFRAVFAESLAMGGSAMTVIPEPPMNVCLPSLKALKVSLDNNTFATLASWDMPSLENLSVLSSDFSYTGPGFHSFFASHGLKITQLELGHSSSSIEEYYLTTPQYHHPHQPGVPLPLPQYPTTMSVANWCPNLKSFICSADAEWHWQSPDWIAPHILLPSHPGIELIGIRDIDKRLREDPDFEGGDVTPYFPLFEQLCSLLRRDAFPGLRFVRDLSVESHWMRLNGGNLSPPSSSLSSFSTSSFHSIAPPPPHTPGGGPSSKRILQFWTRVVEKCRERGVWCEDYTGVNLTVRGLMRASLIAAQTEALAREVGMASGREVVVKDGEVEMGAEEMGKGRGHVRSASRDSAASGSRMFRLAMRLL